MLRLACCLTTEAGLEVVAPFHDALLLHVPIPEVDESLAFVGGCWSRASGALLDGFELRSEINRKKAVFEYPRRYKDGRQADFFEKALTFVTERGLPMEAAACTSPPLQIESLPGLIPRRLRRVFGGLG